MTPAARRAALDQMPANHYSRRMFFLGLRLTAAAQDGITADQKRRFEAELLPLIERIKNNQKRDKRRGALALQVQRADETFYAIMGADWHPRPDNPTERQCRAELLIGL